MPSAERAIDRYCAPLLGGTSAATVAATARADGFKPAGLPGQTALIAGEMIVSLSDTPRACFVQPPATMTFVEGALVDQWAARQPGAQRAAATKGPDGAPVRMRIAPAVKQSLLVTQQTNPRGAKGLGLILAAYLPR